MCSFLLIFLIYKIFLPVNLLLNSAPLDLPCAILSENEKIPFKINFDKEIFIGDAASENENLITVHLEVLINQMTINSGNYKLLIKTVDGIRKKFPKKIFAIFAKSILKLLEGKIEKKTDEIYFEFLFPHDLFQKRSYDFRNL